MSTKELYQQKESIEAEIKRLENELWLKRRELNRANHAFTSTLAIETLGLQLGDIVEVTKKDEWRGEKVYSLKIDKFFASDTSSMTSAEGYIIRKNGTVGIVRKSLYFNWEDRYTWHKVIDTEPPPSPQP